MDIDQLKQNPVELPELNKFSLVHENSSSERSSFMKTNDVNDMKGVRQIWVISTL